MTHEQKVKYFASALNICKLPYCKQQVDLMVRLYDLVCEKEGKTDLHAIAEAEAINEELFTIKQ